MSKLRRDVAALLARSRESLTLAIELFNRPSEVARKQTVLILLHHAFEMLLKAAILRRTGKITKAGDPNTYGFERCLSLAHETLGLIDADERTTLAILDNQRDVAMHFWADVSEDVLYVHAQSSVTLFGTLLERSFKRRLADDVPTRVLPISAHPPTDLALLIDSELAQVDALLTGKTRRGARAAAKLRSLLAFTTAFHSDHRKVTEAELREAVSRRRRGEDWSVILPEVAQLKLSTDGAGLPVTMRITKQGEIPVRIAGPGEEPVGTILTREVNIWDKFSLSRDMLAEKLGLTGPKTHALIYELRLQEDSDCYRVLTRNGMLFKGYSKKALDRLREHLPSVDMKEVWARHRHRFGARRNAEAL